MISWPRVVLDTNVVISGVMKPGSAPQRATAQVLRTSELILGRELAEEFAVVLMIPKFDRYVDRSLREGYLRELLDAATLVPTIIQVTACRDPRDNHVLEAAVNGDATVIITGDADLLALNPFRGIRIVTPADYLG